MLHHQEAAEGIVESLVENLQGGKAVFAGVVGAQFGVHAAALLTEGEMRAGGGNERLTGAMLVLPRQTKQRDRKPGFAAVIGRHPGLQQQTLGLGAIARNGVQPSGPSHFGRFGRPQSGEFLRRIDAAGLAQQGQQDAVSVGRHY
jgi:hypothetical protein